VVSYERGAPVHASANRTIKSGPWPCPSGFLAPHTGESKVLLKCQTRPLHARDETPLVEREAVQGQVRLITCPTDAREGKGEDET